MQTICYRQTDRQRDRQLWGKQYACFSQKGETITCLCIAKMLPEWQTVNTLISIPLAQALLSRYTGYYAKKQNHANAVELLLSNRLEYKVLLARISESGHLVQQLYRKGFHSKICETSRNRCVYNFSDLTCKGIRKGQLQFNCPKGQSPSGRIRFVLV